MSNNTHGFVQTGASYEELLEYAKAITENLTQDFILLTGLYRLEYHHKARVLTVETREFDRIKLDEEKEEENGTLKEIEEVIINS